MKLKSPASCLQLHAIRAVGAVVAGSALVAATVVGVAAYNPPAAAAHGGGHHHWPTHAPSTSTPRPTTSGTAPVPSPTHTPTPAPTTAVPTTAVPTSSSTSAPSSSTPGSQVVFSDHVAQWNVLCSADHYAMNDPIVFPGQPGMSHMHTFYGNTSTDAFSTLSSLSAASPSSCGRGMGTSDLSAYWVPSLMKKNADGTSSVVKTEQVKTVYYRRAGGGMGPGVQPFPNGLRMIAGNAKATSDQSLSIVSVGLWRWWFGESPHVRLPRWTLLTDPRLPRISKLLGRRAPRQCRSQVTHGLCRSKRHLPCGPSRVAARGDLRDRFPRHRRWS